MKEQTKWTPIPPRNYPRSPGSQVVPRGTKKRDIIGQYEPRLSIIGQGLSSTVVEQKRQAAFGLPKREILSVLPASYLRRSRCMSHENLFSKRRQCWPYVCGILPQLRSHARKPRVVKKEKIFNIINSASG